MFLRLRPISGRSHTARRHPVVILLRIRDDNDDNDDEGENKEIKMTTGDKDEDKDEGEDEEIDLAIGIERVANARIVGVPVNSRNKSVFYDFTDSDRKSEGR